MEIKLDFRLTVEENAEQYFEASKKAKKKLKGAKIALEKSLEKLEKVKKKEIVIEEASIKKIKKREWYEKFRWFISSDGFLVIGGRDATTNEIAIKKYTDKHDIVFHTDMAGSPFVVIKTEGKKVPETTMQEATDFTGSFSRGWKMGLGTLAVFHVSPEQVTKEANTGEFLPRGAFMIRGKTQYTNPKMNIAIGMHDGQIMGGPFEAIKKHCEKYVKVIQGSTKPSDIAKKIHHKIGGDLDEIIRALPAGGCEISN